MRRRFRSRRVVRRAFSGRGRRRFGVRRRGGAGRGPRRIGYRF